ncbi:helix-turn-helix domain-containing protein [Lutibacter sp.]|uniref:helix-turn-helix domain-containing protein n=1 Tax=Lutibacter sp. TaxID=1925666 RepID=UPI0035644C31
MVNVEKFAERLNKVMDYYELSAAQFSEKIDVQRSSISHILSGRNKPSLDFVLKILKEFPEVELYWLLNGIGNFPKIKNQTFKPTPTLFSEEEEKTQEPIEIVNEKIASDNYSKNEEIDRIVIFYKNGTFKNYKPG